MDGISSDPRFERSDARYVQVELSNRPDPRTRLWGNALAFVSEEDHQRMASRDHAQGRIRHIPIEEAMTYNTSELPRSRLDRRENWNWMRTFETEYFQRDQRDTRGTQ